MLTARALGKFALLVFGWTLIPNQGPLHAATFVVNTVDDDCDGVCDGVHCSLCDAITSANASPNSDVSTPDEIHFNIPGAGPHIIMRDGPGQLLPAITDPVVIDGFTQPGSAPNSAGPSEEIDAIYQVVVSTLGFSDRAFELTAGKSTIRGLVMQGFQPHGILISGPGGNTISGNFIGTSVEGGLPLFDQSVVRGEVGIEIRDSPENLIGGPDPADRNLISSYRQTQILIAGAGATGNLVAGNFIGPDKTGLSGLSADVLERGVSIEEGASGNLIGGAAPGMGNLISGNESEGVHLDADGNTVQGNLIGLDRTGLAKLENGRGIAVDSRVAGSLIGGATPGAGNVVSGMAVGIDLGNFSHDNTVQGNYIGTDVSGMNGIENLTGVSISGFRNHIGGSAPGAGNVISGNSINVWVVGATEVVIQGNRIGVNAAGTAAVTPQSFVGIDMLEGDGTLIGGTQVGAGNIISGHMSSGMDIRRTTGAVIQGNLIGTDSTGMTAIPNGASGISLSTSNFCQIGGNEAGARNTISGNGGTGVGIVGIQSDTILFQDHSTFNRVQGNYIGIDSAGETALPNGGVGVGLFIANDNLIGGIGPGEGNVISGNGNHGVAIANNRFFVPDENANPVPPAALTERNAVKGNLIGTNAEGTSAVPNQGHGIEMDGVLGATNFIGGPDPGAGNLVSGNDESGIRVLVGDEILVQGNVFGLNAAGDAAIPNGLWGIWLAGAKGAQVLDNVSSGNLNSGLLANTNGFGWSGGEAAQFATFTPEDLVIQGNRIGTDVSGTVAVPNDSAGMVVDGTGHLIGGAGPGDGNLISGNGFEMNPIFFGGLQLEGSGHTVQGNLIGTDLTGTSAVPNSGRGLMLTASNSLVGGAGPGEGNVCSGNESVGIDLNGAGNTLRGNLCGTDISGTLAIPNGHSGLWNGGGGNNLVGGPMPGQGNVFSGNVSTGVYLYTGENNRFEGNLIGVGRHGLPLGNGEQGVHIGALMTLPLPDNNTFGGTEPGMGNTIAHNNGPGIRVLITSGDIPPTGNSFLGNRIFSNAELGIDLDDDGPSANDGGDGDLGANRLQNFPGLSMVSGSGGMTHIEGSLESAADTTYRVEFFANIECDGSGNGEGDRYLGSAEVSTDGGGMAVIDTTLSAAVFAGEFLTSTATLLEGGSPGDTSELSPCLAVAESTGPTPTQTPLGGPPTPTPTQDTGGETPTPNPDFNEDMEVDAHDLLELLSGVRGNDSQYDLTGDGAVDEGDLFRFSGNWQNFH
jgi:hypothetical protein